MKSIIVRRTPADAADSVEATFLRLGLEKEIVCAVRFASNRQEFAGTASANGAPQLARQFVAQKAREHRRKEFLGLLDSEPRKETGRHQAPELADE
jgi:hypothetical protein